MQTSRAATYGSATLSRIDNQAEFRRNAPAGVVMNPTNAARF